MDRQSQQIVALAATGQIRLAGVIGWPRVGQGQRTGRCDDRFLPSPIPEMSETGLTVSGMNGSRYDITVTVPGSADPSAYAATAEKAACARAASVMTAHTAEKTISVVTVHTADERTAVSVALAVASEALRNSSR